VFVVIEIERFGH